VAPEVLEVLVKRVDDGRALADGRLDALDRSLKR
jgi:hypothetical protein